MAQSYWIRVARLTAFEASGDPEPLVAPDQVRPDGFLRIAVEGQVPGQADRIAGRIRTGGATVGNLTLQEAASGEFTTLIQPYTLAANTKYLPDFADDFAAAHCLCSQDIRTLR